MKQLNIFKSMLIVLAISIATFSWSQTTYDYTGGLQTYTVPPGVTSIEISAEGAEGGVGDMVLMTPGISGKGALMQGNFTVTPGDVLTIMVGEQGGSAEHVGGGGGGTFVWIDATDELLIAAGGGGGGGKRTSGDLSNIDGVDATTTESGTNGNGLPNGGGVDGNGGTTPSVTNKASGGAGWNTNGSNGSTHGCSSNSNGGQTPLSGGAGGTGGGDAGYIANGGYGGGGGGNARCGAVGGGGGGGYSGGGAGGEVVSTNFAGGGGGGSYNIGTDQVNSAGGGTGNGQVIITELCAEIEVDVTDEVICLGESFTLDAEGLGVITWDGGVENGEPFTPDETGVFTYTATSDDGGDCGFSIDIEVLELPEVTASVDEDEICIGESIVLTGGGADEYEWFPIEIEDGEDYTPEVGEYTYTVIGTDDETGCENTAEVDVTVYDLPEVTATATDEEICLGESVTLNGVGATTYVWDPEEEDGVEFTPDATGTTVYTVEGTDDHGCSNDATIDITVYEALEITYTSTDEIFGSDGEIDITVIGGNPDYSYDWDNDGTGDFDDTEDLTGLTCGTYVVVVMCDAGCTATETIEVGCQVGIDELNGLEVSVYPNPASEFVTISLEGTFNYTLSTIGGDVVINGNGYNTEEISLNNLAKGIYMINIFAGDQSSVIKLVKE
jgi:hypothetical protein